MTQKEIDISYEIGIKPDDWINAGIFIFLWLQFGLEIAGIGIAIIIILLMCVNELV